MGRDRRRIAGWIAAALAGVSAAVAGSAAAVLAARWARAAVYAVLFAARLATLRAYRRCPDCFRVLRREASVCRSCGARVG